VARSQYFNDSQRKKVKKHNRSNSRYAKSQFDHGHPLRRTCGEMSAFHSSHGREVKEGSHENSRYAKFRCALELGFGS
jgi:hypothetical protein